MLPAWLHGLLSLNIAHLLITVLVDVLILCFIVRFILSMILQGRENRFTRFFANVTGPVVDPLDRVIPAITVGGLSFRISWLFGWWATALAGALLNQALPPGW
jgi:uncharacterized protein YggT (Ycf19 family)